MGNPSDATRWDLEVESGLWARVVRHAAEPLQVAAAAVFGVAGGLVSVDGSSARFAALLDEADALAMGEIRQLRTAGGFALIYRPACQPDTRCVVDIESAAPAADASWQERVRSALQLAAHFVASEADRLEQRARVRQLLAEQRVVAGLHNDIVAENLNDRETAAKDKQRLVAELENQLEARTLELRQTLARVQGASVAKSKFLANMSHELRTPMTSILGYAELLMSGDLAGEPAARAIETIYRNGDHLLNLLNDILDLSRIESDRFPLVKSWVNPVAIAHEAVELVRTRAQLRGLAVELRTVGPIPERIETDPTRWRQILGNLLGNAVKFTREGSVTLSMSCERGDAGNPAMVCEVSDTGIGIPREQLERVFEPFVQADADIARRFGGTGLGLSISRRLAELLGGDLRAESQLGRGSIFRLAICPGPLDGVRMLDAPKAPQTMQPLPATPAAKVLLNGRVLLAEDGPDNQRLIATMLQRAGLQVAIVADGRQAVDAVSAAVRDGAGFDMVLMDLQMPELDGFAAARALREMGYTGPIVALTANAMVGDRESSLSAGCDDYVAKPINRNLLFATLQRYLALAPAASREPAAAGSQFSAAPLAT